MLLKSMGEDQHEVVEENDLDETTRDTDESATVDSKTGLPRSRWLVLLVPLFAVYFAGSRAPWALGSF